MSKSQKAVYFNCLKHVNINSFYNFLENIEVRDKTLSSKMRNIFLTNKQTNKQTN